jgi:hypothetical protein
MTRSPPCILPNHQHLMHRPPWLGTEGTLLHTVHSDLIPLISRYYHARGKPH